jgi:hypothetical protein
MAMLLTLWDNGLQAMCRDHPTPRCRIETPATILERSFVYGEWRMENGAQSMRIVVCCYEQHTVRSSMEQHFVYTR